MPRGRSTFTKRQKEQARQQKQRDKNERKTQRKEEKPEGGVVDEVDEMREMRELAEAQAALFRIGADDDEPSSSELSIPHVAPRQTIAKRLGRFAGAQGSGEPSPNSVKNLWWSAAPLNTKQRPHPAKQLTSAMRGCFQQTASADRWPTHSPACVRCAASRCARYCGVPKPPRL